ncbi:MAG TPA: TetR/AcrR family transcriptional regulator [Mycobacterium sp.]|nr:TetR/AcrR family transcriptional regulator [Mycobacterium sp.]HTX93580.1 TetR/AcrR family transcriptional regulator [Mycobacterium sp.]
MTTNADGGRADVTRRRILRAASYQFARRAYHEVGLDDITTEAGLTKGAIYSHFHSKHALAVAIIETQTTAGALAVQDLLSRNLSGMEMLIDFSYLIAAQDIQTDGFRAALNLLESVGRSEALKGSLLSTWIQALAVVGEKAIVDGDIDKRCNPEDVGRLIVSLYMGLRQTSNLDEPERFLLDLEKSWALVLTGILQPHRIDYFNQFVSRRTALAISSGSAGLVSD